jgi:hypothetical protein
MTGIVRFPLGQIAVTANASLRLTSEEVLTARRRHAAGDWGDLGRKDTLANDDAHQQGWPDCEATRRRGYAPYEEVLAEKNRRGPRGVRMSKFDNAAETR